MSGQFDRRDFEQNPANLKKKRSRKDWDTNNASELCGDGVLTEPEIKQIKEEIWLEKHVPKPSKKEILYGERIDELENKRTQAPLEKREEKELKKLNKKYRKAYKYRHRNMSSNHCCLKTCLAVAVLCVVLVCTVFFGGYHFFVQPYTGITMFEAFDIINGVLSNPDESTIIKNGATAADGDVFFTNLKKALYLDANFTVKDLLELIPSSEGGTGSDSASVADLLDAAGEPDGDSAENTTGNSAFDKLLKDAKFDFSSLKDYDGKTPVWEITDKSIAGVLQQVIEEMDNVPQIKDMLQEYHISIANTIAVRQCLITKDGNGLNTIVCTIQVKIHSLITDIINGMDLGSLDGLVKASLPLIKKTIPESIFLSATTTPEVDKAPILGINAIDSEVLQRLIYTIDSKVLGGKVENVFNSVGNTIFKTIQKINEVATEGEDKGITITPSTADNNGKIEVSLLQAAMKAMGVTNVTSADFLKMVQHLHIVNLNYEGDTNKYIDKNYNDIKNKTTTPEKFNDSKNDLFAAYGIDAVDVEDITAENFVDSFKTIQEKISLNNDKLYASDYASIKADSVLTDAALGQIMNSLIKKQTGDKLDLKIIILDMQATSMRMIAEINVSQTVKSMIGDQFGELESLILSIFPTNMYVEIIVPYDKNTEGFNVLFNFMQFKDAEGNITDNQNESEKMFETIGNLLASFAKDNETLQNFSKEKIVNKLKDTIYPALDNLNSFDHTDVKIELGKNGLQFPTVFEIMATVVNEKLEEGEKLEPAEIQETLKGYYKYNGQAIGDTIGDNLVEISLTGKDTNFVTRELTNKYFMTGYIDNSGAAKNLSEITDNGVFDAVKGIATSVTASNIAKIVDTDKMFNNKKAAKDGNLEITALELAKLISLSGELDKIDNIGIYKNFKFTDMKLEFDKNKHAQLALVIAAELDKDATSVGGFDIEKFATKHLIIEATVDLNNVIGEGDNTAYSTSISINDAKGESIDKLLKIITQMTDASSSDFNKETVAENVGKAIYSAFKSFEDQGIKLTPAEKVLVNAPNGDVAGFTSTNIYEIVGKNTLNDKYETGDDENLKNILNKLNNPNDASKKDNQVIQGDGNTYVNEDGQTLDLVIFNQNKFTIYDSYIGRELRKLVKDSYEDGFDLTNFAILNDPAKRAKNPIQLGDFGYETDSDRRNFDFIVNKTGLDIEDLVKTGTTTINGTEYTTDIFTDFGNGYSKDNGLMFMHFRVGRNQLIQTESPITALLPESIYSGAFINLNALAAKDTANVIMSTYLNNLTANEMKMLAKLSSDDITAPVVDAVNTVIEKEFTIAIGGNNYTVTISQILGLALYSSNNDGPGYANITYTYYEGSLTDLIPPSPPTEPVE